MFEIDPEGDELELAWTRIDVAVGEGFWGQDIDEAIEEDALGRGHHRLHSTGSPCILRNVSLSQYPR